MLLLLRHGLKTGNLRTVFVCSTSILHYKGFISLHSIHRMFFLMVADCVLCALRAVSFIYNVDSFLLILHTQSSSWWSSQASGWSQESSKEAMFIRKSGALEIKVLQYFLFFKGQTAYGEGRLWWKTSLHNLIHLRLLDYWYRFNWYNRGPSDRTSWILWFNENEIYWPHEKLSASQ